VARALLLLRGAIVDVLVDALAGGELPSFADTLLQLKDIDALLISLVRTVYEAV
jgi:hypothetical protein